MMYMPAQCRSCGHEFNRPDGYEIRGVALCQSCVIVALVKAHPSEMLRSLGLSPEPDSAEGT